MGSARQATLPRWVLCLSPCLLGVLAFECANPAVITVDVHSEVACAQGAQVVVFGAPTLAALDSQSQAPSSSSTVCTSDGAGLEEMGTLVLVPATGNREDVAFAVATRPDGQPPDGCLDPAQAPNCIVARRELRFIPHTNLDVVVDLRLDCLGKLCAADQTCVKGNCVSATLVACPPVCNETGLAAVDAGADSAADAHLDAGADAAALPLTYVGRVLNGGNLDSQESTSATFNPAAAIPTGAMLVTTAVAFSAMTDLAGPATLTDSAGNSYLKVIDDSIETGGGTLRVLTFVALNMDPLALTSTLTFVYPITNEFYVIGGAFTGATMELAASAIDLPDGGSVEVPAARGDLAYGNEVLVGGQGGLGFSEWQSIGEYAVSGAPLDFAFSAGYVLDAGSTPLVLSAPPMNQAIVSYVTAR